jgi:HNH endonuclease
MQLPNDKNLPINLLNACFNNTSATYKFYWFLSILDAVEDGQMRIEKRALFARMISLSWYTVNYFHVSFGKQDNIQQAIEDIKRWESIDIDFSQKTVLEKLLNSNNIRTINALRHFDLNVPHRFLSPWLGTGTSVSIYEKSRENTNLAPYSLHKEYIIIQPQWLEYLRCNIGVLKSFCYWHLALYLQARNPNVPDIPSKLQRPMSRGGLSKHKSNFWDLIIKELGPIPCIYTGKKLGIKEYAVEHFVPFQFVAHDLMWNLIPADPSFNSKKGDKLPDFDQYFNAFFEMQNEGIKVVKAIAPRNKFLQEYLPIFSDLKIDKIKYEETIRPMLTIAHNNGFQYLKL